MQVWHVPLDHKRAHAVCLQYMHAILSSSSCSSRSESTVRRAGEGENFRRRWRCFLALQREEEKGGGRETEKEKVWEGEAAFGGAVRRCGGRRRDGFRGSNSGYEAAKECGIKIRKERIEKLGSRGRILGKE